MLLKAYVPIFCIMSLLLGCGSSSTDDSSAVQEDNSAVEDDTSAEEEASNELTGTWQACQTLERGNNLPNYSIFTKYVFTNNNISTIRTIYSDANCQTKTQGFNLTFSYSTNSEKDPKEIDLTTTSASQIYYTQEGVDVANQSCTEPLFSINKDIISEDIERVCPILFEQTDLPKIDETFYLIYKIENNDLFFNNTDGELATEPNNRPTTIDDTVAYSKQ